MEIIASPALNALFRFSSLAVESGPHIPQPAVNTAGGSGTHETSRRRRQPWHRRDILSTLHPHTTPAILRGGSCHCHRRRLQKIFHAGRRAARKGDFFLHKLVAKRNRSTVCPCRPDGTLSASLSLHSPALLPLCPSTGRTLYLRRRGTSRRRALALRAHNQICGRPVVSNVGNKITSIYKYTNMVANPLLAEKELALANRCGSLSSSMQKPHMSSCPTITYEEALRRELEYRKRLESTHPHLLIGLNGAPVLSKDIGTDSAPDLLKRKSTPESSMPYQQSSFHFASARSQPANWYPAKKKVIVRQPSSQAVQISRTNSVPSFWCKICKVDCVTEFNFGAHIGGKKHQARKQQILGNRNTGRPGSQFAGNMNRRPSENAVSGSRNSEPNVGSSSITGPSSDMSSGSRPSEADPEVRN